MAKPGPAEAVDALPRVLHVTSPPRAVVDVLVEICLVLGWHATSDDAREAAERWQKRFLARLRTELSESNRLGRFCLFDFNSSSDYMVQGCAFIEVGVDTPEVQDGKRRRSEFGAYVAAVAEISPDDFEAMCRGMLAELGVDDPVVTPHSADEGIDFYGRLKLEGNLRHVTALPGIYRRLGVWMVGQAKHYKAMQSGTPDIRAVVGSIDLARGKAFGGTSDKYPDLDIRVCDPVFYLFFTTGDISTDGWRLLEQSGVIGMDGQMVAAFLADHAVGQSGSGFDATEFERWLDTYRPK
jgi:hypothetical protein